MWANRALEQQWIENYKGQRHLYKQQTENYAELSTSYVEISLLFIRSKIALEKIEPATATFVDVLKIVRKACTLILSCEGQSVIPGDHHATWAHKCGHALPKGSVMGSRVYMSNQDLSAFARIISMGCGQNLNAWKFELELCEG